MKYEYVKATELKVGDILSQHSALGVGDQVHRIFNRQNHIFVEWYASAKDERNSFMWWQNYALDDIFEIVPRTLAIMK